MAKSQIAHLRKHLKSGRSITPLEALGLYGMFRLAARVKELRDRGWNIKTEMREDPNGKPYAVYYMPEPVNKDLPAFITGETA